MILQNYLYEKGSENIMNKMKKYFSLILIMAGIFLIGNKNVYAASPYWENYFKDFNGFGGLCNSHLYGIEEWKNYSKKMVVGSACGATKDEYHFYKTYYSQGGIFTDVSNVQVTNNNADILTAEVKPYDFSREKKNYEDYITNYEKFTLEEINSTKSENDQYEQKPTWWEYNGFSTEPTTWWEAYGLDSEPTNAVEVVSKIKDLGKASITLNADGKSGITIDSTIQVMSFSKYDARFGNDKAQGLVEILNNLGKYGDIIGTYGSGDKTYNLEYEMEEKEDLSTIINALKGKDITVKFVQNDVISTTYYLNGKDIKSTVNKGFTYYHNISMDTSINKDKINSLVDLKDALYIDFAYHGNLPAPYTMTVNIKNYIDSQYAKKNREQYCSGKDDYSQECNDKINDLTNEQVSKYFENKKFTLLYYNPETNKMEVVNDGLTANANGELELIFDHFSSYVIVGSDDYKITTNPQTSSINVIIYVLMAVTSIAGIGCLTISMKKRRMINR